MAGLATPDSILGELEAVRADASKGVSVLANAEIKLAEATLAFDNAYSKALLAATGSVAERQAHATLETSDLKFAESIAKAEVNRVKVRLRLLEQAQTNIQTQARMVELMWKSAGVGER